MPAKEEEEETCGFCKFMKGGACKDVFVVSRRAAPCGAPEAFASRASAPRALGLTLFPSPRLDSTFSNHPRDGRDEGVGSVRGLLPGQGRG